MNITVFHFIGILITLILVAAVGIYSGSKVKNASDFRNGGGKSGSLMVHTRHQHRLPDSYPVLCNSTEKQQPRYTSSGYF